MTGSADPPAIRDVTFRDLIVFGSLNVGLSAMPAAISPRLPFAGVGAILEDGEPNLMSALRWEYGLTATLRGREADLDAVLRWAEGGGNTVSVRLVSGPGGAGKTRLAAEAAQRLRKRGWCAGILPRGAKHGQVIDASGRAGGGLFLVIDYPEERPGLVEELFEHVADLANPPIPIRFLLVSRRSFDDWLRQGNLLGGRFGRQELAAPGPLEPDDALAVLREAAERFAELTGAAAPPLEGAEAWLALASAHRLALMAMAAGVHAALTGRGDFALGAPELMREIAERELTRVRRVSLTAGLGEFGLERLLGAALMNAQGLDAARVEALGALDIAPGVAGQALLDALAPTPWWGPAPLGGRRLIRLEPDRPAAAFLEAALLANAQPRLPDWLYAASAGTGREFEPVLSRLGWDLSELSADGRGATPLEQALLAMLDAAPERAGDFTEVGSEEGTAFSAAFAARVLEQALKVEQEPAGRAAILNNLALLLSRLGRREEAFAAANEAVELCRRLAAARPEAFIPNLAKSLSNLAIPLSDLGRREQALAAATEAVELYRPLAAARPEAFTPELALSLNNLANRLSGLGRREEAIADATEAVELHRRLAAARPDTFTPDLAMSLNNLANRLSGLGRGEEALAAASEAVVLYRRLAAARPEAFTPDLATSLSNLAIRHSELGGREDALDAITEAVELYRRLAAARPEAFTPNLAKSLSNLASFLSDLGWREEALAAATEAVEFRRRLAAARPEAFIPDLAGSLNNLANRLSDLGRREDGLAAATEAVELYRRLAAARPEAFTPDLANSLDILANGLSNLGRREEAFAAASEAVELHRRLAAARPETFIPDLAGSLNNLSIYLSALGRREEALAAAREAVELHRRLAAARAEAFTPALAMSLNTMANRLSSLGRGEDALAAATEAVELYRRLAAARPETFTPALAMSLNDMVSSLSDLGQGEEALAAATEAVELLSPFFLARPAAFAPRMRSMVGIYLGACQAISIEPSFELLAPITNRFDQVGTSGEV